MASLQKDHIQLKFANFWTSTNFTINTLKSKTQNKRFYSNVIPPNDANGIENSADPEQTALLGAVWSGSALFV